MATTEAVFEVFFGDFLMVLGLLVFGYRSVTHVCKSDGPTPASLPARASSGLGFSALRSFEGMMFFNERVRGPKKAEELGLWTGFARPHASYVLDLKSQMVK